jgi:hypothetical protein
MLFPSSRTNGMFLKPYQLLKLLNVNDYGDNEEKMEEILMEIQNPEVL